MKRGRMDEKQGGNERSAGERETKHVSDDKENWLKDLERSLRIGAARNNKQAGSSEHAKAGTRTMSREQVDLAHDLWRNGTSLGQIEEIMGVPGGTVNRLELMQVVVEANAALVDESLNMQQEETQRRTRVQAEEPKFEGYDAVRWEKAAAEETSIAETRNESKAAALDVVNEVEEEVPESPIPALIVPPSGPDFVRALTDSRVGRKPYYKKGDILRVINKISQRHHDDDYFELLPLKPPGESAGALRRDFEPAEQADVDAVGRAAYTEKEKHSFRCAMEWED